MSFKHMTYSEFSCLVDKESEEQSSEMTCQVYRNTAAMGLILLEVLFKSMESSLSPLPLSLKAELFPSVSVISCHFIYPLAQHLSQAIVTADLFLFPI